MKDAPKRPDPPPHRRPYRPPEFVEYGSIAARTLSAEAGSFTDFMGGQMVMACY